MRYFGTDGVRGVAGVELTAGLVFRLSRAVGIAFRPRWALLSRDTRLSGPALASARAAGLADSGCDVETAGVLPSPAVSHLVPRGGYGLGVVISASHNPPQDNGVKFYAHDGLKLSVHEEERIDARMALDHDCGRQGHVAPCAHATDGYVTFLSEQVSSLSLKGLRIVLDYAHGATAHIAPQLFADLGADLVLLGAEPDGARINASGAAAMERLSREVPARGAEIGVGFDGDGDRVLFVGHRGDGGGGGSAHGSAGPPSPEVERALFPRGRVHRPRQPRGGAVPSGAGIGVERVPVGDLNVAWAMRERGGDLGGEPSGHIIFRRRAATGDGMLAALVVLQALARADTDLASLVSPVPLYPQVRVDIPVDDRDMVMADPDVKAAIAAAHAKLDSTRSLVVRPSGTQPVVRVMAEGEDEAALRALVAGIADAVARSSREAG